jgi:deoxyribonuclease-4
MSDIYHMYWDIGSHTAFTNKITPTISQGIHRGMYTIQFFMGNPKSAWKRQRISMDDIESTKTLLYRFPMNVFSHYPYCANLAGQASQGGLAWNGNYSVDSKLKNILKELEYELDIIANFGLYGKRSGVVIHPGSYIDRDEGHKVVAQTLNKINFPKGSVLLLENCAGEGNKLCRTFEEISGILQSLDQDKKPHVKVCVDTAHIWGQGDYDLRKLTEIDRMFLDFDRLIGMKNFYLLHLNDSQVPLGSKKDAHACLGQGHIWGHCFDPLIYLLNKCKEYQIPMVLETNETDINTLSCIQPSVE